MGSIRAFEEKWAINSSVITRERVESACCPRRDRLLGAHTQEDGTNLLFWTKNFVQIVKDEDRRTMPCCYLVQMTKQTFEFLHWLLAVGHEVDIMCIFVMFSKP